MPYSDLPIPPGAYLDADACAEDLYQAGLVCAAGIDTNVDLVAAHKWFNLAASRGHEDAKMQRQEMADLLTSDEVKIALTAARDWLKLAH
jgi:uncharacterized protein